MGGRGVDFPNNAVALDEWEWLYCVVRLIYTQCGQVPDSELCCRRQWHSRCAQPIQGALAHSDSWCALKDIK